MRVKSAMANFSNADNLTNEQRAAIEHHDDNLGYQADFAAESEVERSLGC